MGFLDNIFGNKDDKTEKNQLFFDLYLSEEKINETLNIAHNLVDSKEYIFIDEDEEVYENENLVKAIEVALEVETIESYLTDSSGYEGVDLNYDVLKTSLSNLLSVVDYYIFFAYFGDVKSMSDKVNKTPEDMLKYILTERASKINEKLENMINVDKDLALDIFEYDKLVKRAESFSSSFKYTDSKDFINSYEQKVNEMYDSQRTDPDTFQEAYDNEKDLENEYKEYDEFREEIDNSFDEVNDSYEEENNDGEDLNI